MTTGPEKELRKWVPAAELTDLWLAPTDPTLMKDLDSLEQTLAMLSDPDLMQQVA